jgi:hypothetical protein
MQAKAEKPQETIRFYVNNKPEESSGKHQGISLKFERNFPFTGLFCLFTG